MGPVGGASAPIPASGVPTTTAMVELEDIPHQLPRQQAPAQHPAFQPARGSNPFADRMPPSSAAEVAQHSLEARDAYSSTAAVPMSPHPTANIASSAESVNNSVRGGLDRMPSQSSPVDALSRTRDADRELRGVIDVGLRRDLHVDSDPRAAIFQEALQGPEEESGLSSSSNSEGLGGRTALEQDMSSPGGSRSRRGSRLSLKGIGNAANAAVQTHKSGNPFAGFLPGMAALLSNITDRVPTPLGTGYRALEKGKDNGCSHVSSTDNLEALSAEESEETASIPILANYQGETRDTQSSDAGPSGPPVLLSESLSKTLSARNLDSSDHQGGVQADKVATLPAIETTISMLLSSNTGTSRESGEPTAAFNHRGQEDSAGGHNSDEDLRNSNGTCATQNLSSLAEEPDVRPASLRRIRTKPPPDSSDAYIHTPLDASTVVQRREKNASWDCEGQQPPTPTARESQAGDDPATPRGAASRPSTAVSFISVDLADSPTGGEFSSSNGHSETGWGFPHRSQGLHSSRPLSRFASKAAQSPERAASSVEAATLPYHNGEDPPEGIEEHTGTLGTSTAEKPIHAVFKGGYQAVGVSARHLGSHESPAERSVGEALDSGDWDGDVDADCDVIEFSISPSFTLEPVRDEPDDEDAGSPFDMRITDGEHAGAASDVAQEDAQNLSSSFDNEEMSIAQLYDYDPSPAQTLNGRSHDVSSADASAQQQQSVSSLAASPTPQHAQHDARSVWFSPSQETFHDASFGASRSRAPSFTSSITDQTQYHTTGGGSTPGSMHSIRSVNSRTSAGEGPLIVDIKSLGLPDLAPGAPTMPLASLVHHLGSLSSQTFKALSPRRSDSESCDSDSDGVGMSAWNTTDEEDWENQHEHENQQEHAVGEGTALHTSASEPPALPDVSLRYTRFTSSPEAPYPFVLLDVIAILGCMKQHAARVSEYLHL